MIPHVTPLAGILPSGGMRRDALISECGKYRWWLRRQWGDRGGTVCWNACNPSTADHMVDDPSLRRMIHFSRAWGFGALIVVNQYPVRTSSVAECRTWAAWEKNGPDWSARDAMQNNLSVAEEANRNTNLSVAAWGAIAWDEAWTDMFREAVTQDGRALYCLGVTASGAPKHPMARGLHRVPDDQQPVVWRA